MIRFGIFSGGTGGHIAPAVAVVEVLEKKNIPYVFSLGGLKVSFPFKGGFLEYEAGEITPRAFMKNVKGIFQTFDSVNNSSVVLGFGGYPIIPPAINSIINNKPLFLFEGDAVPGRANRFFSPFSRKVFCAFRKTLKFFKNSEFVGMPVRNLKVYPMDIVRKKLGIYTSLPVVGFIGGSQGSVFLNKVAKRLSEYNDMFVLCISGKRGEEQRRENFISLKFLEDISLFYSAVDVVVARAGMSTIGEIAYFRKPAVFIPYPYAGGHQMFNAMDVVEFGAAEIVLEDDFDMENFRKTLKKLLKESEKYKNRLSMYVVENSPEIILEKVLEEV